MGEVDEDGGDGDWHSTLYTIMSLFNIHPFFRLACH